MENSPVCVTVATSQQLALVNNIFHCKQNMKWILWRVYTHLIIKIPHTKQLCPETFACWKIRNKDLYENLQKWSRPSFTLVNAKNKEKQECKTMLTWPQLKFKYYIHASGSTPIRAHICWKWPLNSGFFLISCLYFPAKSSRDVLKESSCFPI